MALHGIVFNIVATIFMGKKCHQQDLNPGPGTTRTTKQKMIFYYFKDFLT
jgi:hypothetical protein